MNKPMSETMARRKVKAEADKSIPELADESARKTVRGMCGRAD